jgi:hypothetical protein
MVVAGMAKGMPAISILVVISQYSPCALKAEAENPLAMQTKLEMNNFFMRTLLVGIDLWPKCLCVLSDFDDFDLSKIKKTASATPC